MKSQWIIAVALTLALGAEGCDEPANEVETRGGVVTVPTEPTGPTCNLDGDGTCDQCDECGDGVLGAAEECDDGNLERGDGCSPTCEREWCGNGILDWGEECDYAAPAPGDPPCHGDCKFGYCGDGVVDEGEECDDSSSGCSHCQLVTYADGGVADGPDAGAGPHCPSPSDLCTIGAPPVASCDDPCLAAVCADNPWCCTNEWSASCVVLYVQSCGVQCDECGNGVCGGGESCTSCPGDCGTCTPSCGDGLCDGAESCSSCPADCGDCPVSPPDAGVEPGPDAGMVEPPPPPGPDAGLVEPPPVADAAVVVPPGADAGTPPPRSDAGIIVVVRDAGVIIAVPK